MSVVARRPTGLTVTSANSRPPDYVGEHICVVTCARDNCNDETWPIVFPMLRFLVFALLGTACGFTCVAAPGPVMAIAPSATVAHPAPVMIAGSGIARVLSAPTAAVAIITGNPLRMATVAVLAVAVNLGLERRRANQECLANQEEECEVSWGPLVAFAESATAALATGAAAAASGVMSRVENANPDGATA